MAEITTKSASSLPTEPKENAKFLYVVKYNSLNLKLSIAQGPTRQFEPFFVRFFLFDIQSCSRVSEEFRIVASTDELNSLLNEGQRTTRAGSNTSSGQEQVINGIRKSTLMHQAANQVKNSIVQFNEGGERPRGSDFSTKKNIVQDGGGTSFTFLKKSFSKNVKKVPPPSFLKIYNFQKILDDLYYS